MNNDNLNPDALERSSETTDLSWLAFRYVANELDATTRRQFEIRLEQDQAARDAIVEALDNARMLNLAVSSQASESQEATCELPSRESGERQRVEPVRSGGQWSKALVGVAVAGLLAIVLPQLWRNQTTMEFAQSTRSLAEAWADADWEVETQVEIAIAETELVYDNQADGTLEHLEDVHQDDWMAATLIDMAQDLSFRPSESGG